MKIEKTEKKILEVKRKTITPIEAGDVSSQKEVVEFDDIKKQREEMFKEQKLRQNQIKNEAIEVKKAKKTLITYFVVTLLLLLLFAPIYPNKNTNINQLYYLSKDDIKTDHPLNKYFSPFQYYRYTSEIANSNKYIKNSEVKYNLKKMEVNVKLEERKPLAKDSENNIYFLDGRKVKKEKDIQLYAPVISGFDDDTLKDLLINLNELDYSILLQIDTIEYVGTKDSPQLLKMGMSGDNTVYINLDQIKTKLKYYNQIKQIIDEKGKGKSGIIHLNIGDYYEPK